MATPVADLNFCVTQILEKLLASPRAARYTLAIGENADFPVLQELKDNALLADETVCMEILSTPGHGWRQQFMTYTADLDSGTAITPSIGEYGEVKAKIGSTYSFSTPTKNREECLRMIAFPALYSSRAFHWLQDGIILSPADKVQVQYVSFTRTTACQSPQTAEPAIIYGGIQNSEKIDGESPFFAKYNGLFQVATQLVKTGQVIPPQEVLERLIQSPQQRPQEAAA